MLDHLEFITEEKSMLIAPAGFGKTHTIAECLKEAQSKGKQLILTHTHAGVASIKEKLKKEEIHYSSYEVETITSFAQKYVLSFYTGADIPDQENSSLYYPFVLEKAISLLKLKPIRKILLNTYAGLFVDEYQDCTVKQHELILLLSELFPTHILGDFLQGIFDFSGDQLVDMINPSEMKEFSTSKYELDKPQRWLNGNNAQLGEDLKKVRKVLINKEEINLEIYPSFEVHVSSDIYKEKYKVIIDLLTTEKSVLVMDPITGRKDSRIDFIKRFQNIPRLIESIDDKEFYQLAKQADTLTPDNALVRVFELCFKLFNSTGMKTWVNDKGFKKKTKEVDKAQLTPIQFKITLLQTNVSFSLLSEVLSGIKNLTGIKCYRRELFYSFCKALEEAEYKSIPVYEAMVTQRNLIRRVGRKVYGKCIGTTLLTKGLEFDTVAIINAHKFESPKHLYVAMTRACKRLLIFTESPTLKPYR